jgi:hypothetical protein
MISSLVQHYFGSYSSGAGASSNCRELCKRKDAAVKQASRMSLLNWCCNVSRCGLWQGTTGGMLALCVEVGLSHPMWDQSSGKCT